VSKKKIVTFISLKRFQYITETFPKLIGWHVKIVMSSISSFATTIFTLWTKAGTATTVIKTIIEIATPTTDIA